MTARKDPTRYLVVTGDADGRFHPVHLGTLTCHQAALPHIATIRRHQAVSPFLAANDNLLDLASAAE